MIKRRKCIHCGHNIVKAVYFNGEKVWLHAYFRDWRDYNLHSDCGVQFEGLRIEKHRVKFKKIPICICKDAQPAQNRLDKLLHRNP